MINTALAKIRFEYNILKKRFFPGQLQALPKHGLPFAQVYQHGENFFASLSSSVEADFSSLDVKEGAKFVSIGSCFAEKFPKYLKQDKIEYLQLEPGPFDFSANWGRVYTISTFRHVVKYSFDDSTPLIEHSEYGYFDPYREPTVSNRATRKECLEGILKHRKASKSAFENCDVLVFTLGQNVTWYDRELGIYWGHTPGKKILNSGRFEMVTKSLKENVEDLQIGLEEIWKHNPKVKIILSISPVPAWATFEKEQVIQRSFEHKCLLRCVAGEAVRANALRVFYLPTIEMVMCYNPSHYLPDNRHVSKRILKKIFSSVNRSLRPGQKTESLLPVTP